MTNSCWPGQQALQACINSIQLELNCIELEARLKKGLFNLISTETERHNFYYSSDTEILDSIKSLIDTGNSNFRRSKSLEQNRELQNQLIEKLIVVEGPDGREFPLYREILSLARTGRGGDLPCTEKEIHLHQRQHALTQKSD